MEQSLNGLRRGIAFAGADNRGGNAQRHFAGEAWAGERRHAIGWSHVAQDAAHGDARFELNALGHAHKRGGMALKFGGHLAERLRRNRHHNHFAACDGAVKGRLYLPVRRQPNAGKQSLAVAMAQFLKQGGVDIPHGDGVAVLVQHFCQRGTPCACT
jgi:hypothetical protein